MLGSQTGQEERDLGGFGIAGETDEGTGDGILEAVGPLCPGLGAADLGVGVVAGGLGEAGGLGADLLNGGTGESVVLLEAEEGPLVRLEGGVVGVSEGAVHGGVVEAADEVGDSQGELEDLGIRG